MSQSDALQQATERLDAAADQLEYFLHDMFAGDNGGASIVQLREQLRFLSEERDRLLGELDVERSRVRRLRVANEDVSRRLDTVMMTLKELTPAVPG